MRLPPAKEQVRAPYIGDKGSNIISAKELLYGARSKKDMKVISVEYHTTKHMLTTEDTLYVADSKGGMSAYNFVTKKFKVWNVDMSI